MTIEECRKMLSSHIQEDGGLHNLGHYLSWKPGDEKITLDSEFTAEELEAIAYYMKHYKQLEIK